MKTYKLYIAAGLFTASIGFAPISAHAATFTGNDILTTAVATTEIVAWNVKNVFTSKAEFQKKIEVDGEATFNSDTFFDKLFKVKKLKVTGDATLGNAPDDLIIIEGKIKRTLGKVYVNDNLRVTGDFDLDTASIDSDEIANETLLSKDFLDGKIQGKDVKDGTITADKLAEMYQVDFTRTIVVSATGTDTENGTALKAAVDGISDASVSKPYLVLIEPGIYDLGTDSLDMQAYVDIAGSGPSLTTIKSTMDSTLTHGVINGASNTELRDLTIEGDTSGIVANGYYSDSGSPIISNVTVNMVDTDSISQYGLFFGGGSPLVRHVKVSILDGNISRGIHVGAGSEATILKSSITVANGTSTSIGLNGGSSGSATVIDTTISTSGGGAAIGIDMDNGTFNLRNVSMEMSGGSSINTGIRMLTSSGIVNLERSTISSSDKSLDIDVGSTTVNIGASQIDGTVDNSGGGTLTCVGAYDGSFAALDTSCT